MMNVPGWQETCQPAAVPMSYKAVMAPSACPASSGSRRSRKRVQKSLQLFRPLNVGTCLCACLLVESVSEWVVAIQHRQATGTHARLSLCPFTYTAFPSSLSSRGTSPTTRESLLGGR